MSRAIAIALAAAALLAAAAQAAKPPTVFVNGDSVTNYKFSPRISTINRRQAVRWQWDSNAAHNVTFRKLGKSSVTGASDAKQGTSDLSCFIARLPRLRRCCRRTRPRRPGRPSPR